MIGKGDAGGVETTTPAARLHLVDSDSPSIELGAESPVLRAALV